MAYFRKEGDKDPSSDEAIVQQLCALDSQFQSDIAELTSAYESQKAALINQLSDTSKYQRNVV